MHEKIFHESITLITIIFFLKNYFSIRTHRIREMILRTKYTYKRVLNEIIYRIRKIVIGKYSKYFVQHRYNRTEDIYNKF